MEFTTGKVAKMIGISDTALRNYDKNGLMIPKYKNKYRIYTDEDIEKLREMQVLYQLGISHRRQIDHSQFGEKYDRNTVLTNQIHVLKEQERLIQKQIRLATLIRAGGAEMLGLKNPESSVKENTARALDLMLEPEMEELFSYIESLSPKKTCSFNASVTDFLKQFLDLYIANTPKDDPEIIKLITGFMNLIQSLTHLSLKRALHRSRHALMLYLIGVFYSDNPVSQECNDLSNGLSDFIAECFFSLYTDDLLEETENALAASMQELTNGNEHLSDAALKLWGPLLIDYLGPFKPKFNSARSYLSVCKDLLSEGYEESEAFSNYLDQLFNILEKEVSDEHSIIHHCSLTPIKDKDGNTIGVAAQEIRCYIDAAGRRTHIFIDEFGHQSKLTETNPDDYFYQGRQWCPRCLKEISMKNDLWTCPDCGYEVSDEMARDPIWGAPSFGAALDYHEMMYPD